MTRCLFSLVFLCLSTLAHAQPRTFPPPVERQPPSFFGLGLGFSQIENASGEKESFLMFTVQPEFSLGPVGVGLLGNVRLNVETGEVRKEDYDTVGDVLGIIRYVRYGFKGNEGLYGRFGALDAAALGYGQQVYLYKNEVSLDEKVRGIELDYDAGRFGMETVWGSFTERGVFGARAFYRPLQQLPYPIINGLTVGASVSGDLSDEARYVNTANPGATFILLVNSSGAPTPLSVAPVPQEDGALVLVGADVGLPLLNTSVFALTPYAGLTKILAYGTGTALGVQATVRLPLLGRLDARLEQRFNGEQYLPSYFNGFYEVEKLEPTGEEVRDTNGEVVGRYYQSKRNQLAVAEGGNGWHGSLSGHVLGLVRVTGAYERLYDVSESGWLHIGAEAGTTGGLPFVARAFYDRWNISGETDLLRFQDEDALLTAELGYKPFPYLLVSMVYQQSFAPIEEGGEVVGYEKQRRFEPRVQFLIQF